MLQNTSENYSKIGYGIGDSHLHRYIIADLFVYNDIKSILFVTLILIFTLCNSFNFSIISLKL